MVNRTGLLESIERQLFLELQHINVKLLLDDAQDIEPEVIIPVFHRWIQGQVCEELLLDVANYAHVPNGPGVVLIGHEADYGLDNTDGRLGIRYNRKAVLPGDNQDKLRQSLTAALLAAQRLQEDNSLNGKFHFNGRDIEIAVNDRLLAPNDDATRQTLEPEIRGALSDLFAGEDFELSFESDRRKLFGARVTALRAFAVAELLQNLDR